MESLQKSRILVGAYQRALEGYITYNNRRADVPKMAYFVSTPLPFFFEDPNVRSRPIHARILSVWPSLTMFANAVKLAVDLQLSNRLRNQRVLLLTYAETADSLECEFRIRTDYDSNSEIGK